MERKSSLACVFACILFFLVAATALGQDEVKDQAVCYTTWDENYLYIAFKVDCPDVQGKQAAPNADVTGDDSVSVFVETDNAHSEKITPRCFSMDVSAAGGCRFRAGGDAGVLEPLSVWTFKYGATIQGTLNNSDDVDMGYSVEMAIPWDLMKTQAPRMGNMVSFNVVIRRHGASSSSFISLASRVKTEEDVLDPSKWMNLLFVSYSLGAVMPGGEKVLSARSVVRPPLINGTIQDREWSKNSSFSIELPMQEGFVYEAKYPVQKLVFAPYDYRLQMDPRRQATYTPLAAPDGGLVLQEFPIRSLGPWFSSDRVQWHREELSDMVSSGIDVVLPRYLGDTASRSAYSAKGLDCLVTAIAELKSEGRSYPLVGMLFDVSAMQAVSGGNPPSLNDEGARRVFYGMIRDFFSRIPREFRAWTQTGKPRAGELACIVFLENSRAVCDLGPEAVAYVNERFERDFGSSIVWIGDSSAAGIDGLDGYRVDAGSVSSAGSGIGRIRTVSVSAGHNDCAISEPDKAAIVSRMGGQTYADAWAKVLLDQPQWVFCDAWNNLLEGSALCATREYGRKYIDATRAHVSKWRGGREFEVQYLRCDVPRVIPSKQFAMAELTLRNAGTSPWSVADGYALSYRWYRSGRFHGESKVRRPLERDIAPGETVALPLGIATVNAQNAPIPEGECELRIELLRQSDGKWLSSLGAQPLIVPITIGGAPEWKATYLTASVPTMLESGRDYQAGVRVRNDGSKTWAKGQVKLGCRLYKVLGCGPDLPEGSVEEVPTKSIRVLLSKDCKPGEIAEFSFALNLTQPDKKPIAAWNTSDPWSYQLGLDLYNGQNWLSEFGSQSVNRAVGIFDADYGVRIADSSVPAKLSAGEVIEAKVVLRNNGARPWDRRRAGVGCHWYHLDGLELQWESDPAALPATLQPGWPAVVTASAKAPEYDGQYVLMWDMNIDGQWVSTLPLSRGGDVLPVFVEVTGGKLAFADLSNLYDVSAASPDTNPTAGDFDGKGGSFPAEHFPPDAPFGESASRMYPSGYKWESQASGDGRISFMYPEKAADKKSAVACNGQKVTVDRGKYAAVHILGASTSGEASGTFSLNYENGAQDANLGMSDWSTGPKHGEKVGCAARHRHTHGGDEPGTRCFLYHYTITLDPSRTLTSITLPSNNAIRVVAVTFERATTPATD